MDTQAKPQVPEGEVAATRAGFDKILVTERGFDFEDARALYAFARMAMQSACLPRCYQMPEQVVMAVAMGRELGIQPVQAIYSIGLINSQLVPYGDLTVSRIDSSPVIVDREEWFEVDGEKLACGRRPRGIKPGADIAAVCRLTYKRPGFEGTRVHDSYYHLEEAEESGLYPARDRSGNVAPRTPWNAYTARMLMFKARNWGARDVDPNVLKGFGDEGEVRGAWSEERAREPEYEIKGSIDVSQVRAAPENGGASTDGDEKAKAEDAAFDRFRAQAQETIAQKAATPAPAEDVDGPSDSELALRERLDWALETAGLEPDQVVIASETHDADLIQGTIEVRAPGPDGRELVGTVGWDAERGKVLFDVDIEGVVPDRIVKLSRAELLTLGKRLAGEIGLEGKDLSAFVREQFPGSHPTKLTREQLAALAWALERAAKPA